MTATISALGAATAAENAAIFTYGVITAFAAPARRRTIVEQISAHRARRDALERAITAAGGVPPAAPAGYTLPVEVTGPTSAARAALAAENDCARAYRALLEQAETPEARRIGVDGLDDSAVRIAYWRAALGISPATLAFPGAPA
ncbi:ferritin-like domain-containing protein [Gordonia sp. ABSL1-1]|uniref:ferritin-like domain-containing protein n=1 Tax=Gordonia sp. ABSL1-1 TaxID=3053923 RepID=UPI00257447C7|nr:ferritin-like domain-containing protein [Gordonia sp. ABSL1-1]MDL9936297.1 ferritin-like domain-containing protein [Gordonia sp. ABSL1-1]